MKLLRNTRQHRMFSKMDDSMMQSDVFRGCGNKTSSRTEVCKQESNWTSATACLVAEF